MMLSWGQCGKMALVSFWSKWGKCGQPLVYTLSCCCSDQFTHARPMCSISLHSPYVILMYDNVRDRVFRCFSH